MTPPLGPAKSNHHDPPSISHDTALPLLPPLPLVHMQSILFPSVGILVLDPKTGRQEWQDDRGKLPSTFSCTQSIQPGRFVIGIWPTRTRNPNQQTSLDPSVYS
ncbi:unnamed protein product [Protopolystoma xenopodis]|uniref:Uncharacterized protein n=1 Tax=Protopolystoma xenopodis TaxID=117903 RepID=A0A3S5B0I3_9PLAT|nr:unnamed protein product [Protopolystoma xenopodis]